LSNIRSADTNFDLSKIAAHLEALEETIIFKLIDRAQFHLNAVVYVPGKSGFDGVDHKSLLQLRLDFQEKMDAQFGRFCVPEERPFCKRLPASKRKSHVPPTGLVFADVNAVNLSSDILSAYLGFLPHICRNGDDGHYGSSVEHDVFALQSIARRIHYGSLYVAESKYRSNPKLYGELIKGKDREGLLAVLTRREVEEKIVARIQDKVALVQYQVNREIRHAIDPVALVAFYRDCIIPLTKEGEVRYLLNRTKSKI
jgi:chorismate mutase